MEGKWRGRFVLIMGTVNQRAVIISDWYIYTSIGVEKSGFSCALLLFRAKEMQKKVPLLRINDNRRFLVVLIMALNIYIHIYIYFMITIFSV